MVYPLFLFLITIPNCHSEHREESRGHPHVYTPLTLPEILPPFGRLNDKAGATLLNPALSAAKSQPSSAPRTGRGVPLVSSGCEA